MAWWTAKQALSVVVGFWPVTVVWLAVVVGTAIFAAQWHRAALTRAIWALLPFAFSAAIIFCGVVFNNPGGLRQLSSTAASALLAVLLVGQLALSVFLVWRLSGIRIVASVLSVGGVWLSFWGAFVSTMSMSGEWL
jgi:hypothetical protein